MDRIVESMNSRFVNNSPLYMDLSLLSLVNFNSFKHGLPKTALKVLSKNLIRFTVNDVLEEFHQKLREELVSFGNNWNNLKNQLKTNTILKISIQKMNTKKLKKLPD